MKAVLALIGCIIVCIVMIIPAIILWVAIRIRYHFSEDMEESYDSEDIETVKKDDL